MRKKVSAFPWLPVLLWWVTNSTATLSSQSLSGNSLTARERQNLFQQALAFLPENHSFHRRGPTVGEIPPRCGTSVLALIQQSFDQFDLQQQLALRPLFSRPEGLPGNYISAGGRFKIHYAPDGVDAVPGQDENGNGVPDYVEQVAIAFEFSYAREVGDLGYRPPPDDGIDGSEYDVYIQALADGFYGLTTLENSVPGTVRNDVTSFIKIDNDFQNGQSTHGLAGAQVTAAHEFFHAIQLGYRTALVPNDFFYYELCSSWMEDVVYDDINDYYFNVPLYFQRIDSPFNRFELTSLTNYGAAVWNHMLVEKYGNPDMIRQTWEFMQTDMPILESIDKSLESLGSTFRREFTALASWNYFTAGRADPASYYEEGAAFPEVKLALDALLRDNVTVVDSMLSLSDRYYRFTTETAGRYLLSTTADNVNNLEFVVIREASGFEIQTDVLLPGQVLDLGSLPAATRIVVIATNHLALDGRNRSEFDTERSRFRFVVEGFEAEAGRQRGVTSIYPNPFLIDRDGTVTIEFVPQSTTQLTLRIVNSAGKVVRDVSLARAAPGLSGSFFAWDGRDNRGEPVASGIYILQLRQGNFHDHKKFAVVRE